MGETKHDGLAIPGRVVLAHEQPFDLCPFRVDPPTRQVIAGAEHFTLEPRVMQVLVVLAKARGQVLARDELVDRCWDGRIVGDDAINRVIGRLRQLAEMSEGGFRIETIPRVGYRLIEDGAAAPELDFEVGSLAAPVARPTRRMVIGSTVAIGAIALGGASFGLLSRRREPPALAKAYYQRGLATRGQGYSTEYEQAVGYFRQAVQVDPEFADAWGALAWSYRTLLASESRPDAAHLTLMAKSASERALELDADNADARLTLLLLKPNFRRWAEVEQGLQRLLAVHPNHSISQFHLAYVLGETGRWREAIPHMQAVSNREPLWPMAKFRLFQELGNSGRIEEADARIEEVNRLAPRNFTFWSSRIQHLMLTGRQAEASALAADEAARPIADRRLIDRELMILDAYVSRSSERRKIAIDRLLEDTRKEESNMAFEAAINAAILGDLSTAFSLLDGHYLGRGPWASKRDDRPPTHPLFNLATAPLRHDGRFARLLRDIGLEAFWRQTSTQPDFRRLG